MILTEMDILAILKFKLLSLLKQRIMQTFFSLAIQSIFMQ